MSNEDKPKSSEFGWRFWAVVGVLMLLAALAFLPNLLKGRFVSHSSCVANLKAIDGAVQQWAFENKKAPTDTYSFNDPLLLRQMRGSALPLCPGGGRYTAGANVADKPKCSLAGSGHTL